ncbi:MAG: AbrB/MazE/SpoVT family DNA-binding domain-containing protein [Acidobacteria bacterium]|nr:AbrB/MazE/SpoVT family DNA-binding domain-containing protein [Acidobacteriota bacterium]
MAAELKPIAATRLDEHGQITIPAKFRKALRWKKDSQLLMIQVGDALMVLPQDKMLDQISTRIQNALKEKGISVEEALAGLAETRKELFKELHGDINE